jgi:flagellar hook-associated protein 3 FlgL
MRIGTFSSFGRVLLGLRNNQFQLARAQEQLSSGRRILRPSDDPVGASRAIRIERQLADVARYRESIRSGRSDLDTAASSLQDVSSLMAEARELVLRGMNGTLSQEDRAILAEEFDLIREQLLDISNLRSGDRYLFGGTESSTAPFSEITVGGVSRVLYGGNEESQFLRVGDTIEVPIGVPGSEIFGRLDPTGVLFDGLTGVSAGLTANEGSGYTSLELRHDSTDAGALATVGVALFGGGAEDSLLGANALTIDPVAGTIQLGNGPVTNLPSPTAPISSDFIVTNEDGGELHLDLTGYTGAAYTDTVTGNGSVSLDGTNFTALSFTETDLELRDDEAGIVLHVDATSVRRAGSELVTFGGTTNVFDLMQGISDDLRNGNDLTSSEIVERLGQRLGDIDRNHQNVLTGLGVLGSRSARLQSSDGRALDVEVLLESQLSDVADADLAKVAIDLTRSDMILQLAQASGARLIQTTLLNFLG